MNREGAAFMIILFMAVCVAVTITLAIVGHMIAAGYIFFGIVIFVIGLICGSNLN